MAHTELPGCMSNLRSWTCFCLCKMGSRCTPTPTPVRLHRKRFVREHSGGGHGTVDNDLQRHVRQGYLWDWGRTALAPQPRDQCPGWPRAVPWAGPRPQGASPTAATSSGAPPCGMEAHTWASPCITSGASSSQSASATEGAAPPLKGAVLLVCKSTPPSAAATPFGL